MYYELLCLERLLLFDDGFSLHENEVVALPSEKHTLRQCLSFGRFLGFMRAIFEYTYEYRAREKDLSFSID